jgi:hypothetical protein
VAIFVTLDENDAISLVYSKIDPSELVRARATEMDRGLSIRGIASGGREFEEAFLFFLSPLLCPLRMVSFKVLLQMGTMHETGLATLRCTGIGTIVIVDHLVVLQGPPFGKCSPTVRDGALERSLTRVYPFMLCSPMGMHSLATPLEPTQHLTVLQALPLPRTALTGRRRRWWWA